MAWQVSHLSYKHALYICYVLLQTWDLLETMFNGFTGLCEELFAEHPGYYVIPVRISGSAIESVFSCLKYISGGNLSSVNYSTSLMSLATQKEVPCNSKGEDTYRNVPLNLK